MAKQLTHWLDEGPVVAKQTPITVFDCWHEVFVLIWSAWFLPSVNFNVLFDLTKPGETWMFWMWTYTVNPICLLRKWTCLVRKQNYWDRFILSCLLNLTFDSKKHLFCWLTHILPEHTTYWTFKVNAVLVLLVLLTLSSLNKLLLLE